MKHTDLFLNLFAAAAFLTLGFIGGYVYHTTETIERTVEVLRRDGVTYELKDLTYIANGDQSSKSK
jgi:hypothetical protein